MRVTSVLALALSAAVLAASAEAADPSWSSVLSAVRKPIGSYKKQTTTLEDDHISVQAEEFLDYDLRAKWLDRRITRIEDVKATRAKPALRFVYRPGKYLMWNPNATQRCGTPWVRLSAKALRALNGGDLDFFSATEPATVLSTLRSTPRVVRRDVTGTTFLVLVPGDTGLPASQEVLSHPDEVAKLHRGTTTAFVHVAKNNGPIRITVDITRAAETIGEQSFGDAKARQIWTVERPPHRLDRALPAKVAEQSCLG